MAETDINEIDIQLELKDRINYPHILQATILYIKRAIASGTVDIDKIEDMMWDFFTDIPHDWYDEEFSSDVRKSFIQKDVDCRPLWGEVKISYETCEKYGIKTKKILTKVNIYLLKNAIINLMHRRDMLVRKKKIEYSTGKNLMLKTLDDLATIEDNEEDLIITSEDTKILNELKEIEKDKDINKDADD